MSLGEVAEEGLGVGVGREGACGQSVVTSVLCSQPATRQRALRPMRTQ